MSYSRPEISFRRWEIANSQWKISYSQCKLNFRRWGITNSQWKMGYSLRKMNYYQWRIRCYLHSTFQVSNFRLLARLGSYIFM